ncbi:poly(A) RNA polymerase GLD2 isoform X2 [Antennarius striatus]|uniref:poly(A) RNA polymerase GLD2 isoform X2 n=1 Tax=Antennarius striatus TaxID=241820 RepID=UPI0035B12C32
MFPWNPAAGGGRLHINAPNRTPSVPPYNPQNRAVGSSHALERLPSSEWEPKPSTYPAPAAPRTPTTLRARKRQHEDYSTPVVKRYRLDSSSHSLNRSPYIFLPPTNHPQPVVEGSVISGYPHLCFPWYPEVSTVPQGYNNLQTYASDKLSKQMIELFEACKQQTSDLDRKEMCRAQLQKDIQYVYPGARLYLTGSSMNGLGCRSSDADLCLVLKEVKRQDSIHALSLLQGLVKSLSYIGKTQLIRAKVPILRFREKGSELEFDLNINNTVGIRNTFLLRSYAHADVRVRPIILVVKKWARHNQINDASKGTLSSYGLVLMILHYLQTVRTPVLPSLQRDYPGCFDPDMAIDMVPDGSKNIPSYNSRNQSSLGELLLGFLRYYAVHFRWNEQVISVREGKVLPKNNSFEWRNKYVCVEEPFERNNVARAVHEKIKFDAIKAQFVESFQALQSRRDLDSILPVSSIIKAESLGR